MSFFRISNPIAAAFDLRDLGVTISSLASNVVLSNQFSVDDLYLSADLETAIIAGDLTVQIDYGTGFTSIAAVDYTNRDALAAFLNVFELTNENNNEDLVDGSEVNSSGPAGAPLHKHDGRYFTETELGSTTAGSSGGTLIGVNDDSWDTEYPFLFTTVQGFINGLYGILTTQDLDTAYDNDTDGILHVDGTTKPLDFESNNVNDVLITRKSGADKQTALMLDVSANELFMGSAIVGALPKIDVRVRTNLVVDGDFTVAGTWTDTTVDNLNIINANIRLRDGATGIAGADGYLEIERGTSGNDARLLWSHSTTRWMAGIVGAMYTIALLERNEVVTGVWEFQGAATTDPSLYMTNKTAAATTQLGTSTQIPMEVINNKLAIYDKSNSRNKWLSVDREYAQFTGRDNSNNSDEYARLGLFSSMETGYRMGRASTLVGIKIQTAGVETWTARVRKNGVVTNLASLASGGAIGAQDYTLNIDFVASDYVQVYIDGTSVDRPLIVLEFAEKF